MSRQRFLSLAVIAVLALGAALFISSRRNPAPPAHGGPLFPTLAAELNTVSALSVRRAGTGGSVTLHEHDGAWTVAERGDYPADVSKVRKLVLALSDAKIVEQKTSDPAKFSIIGVEDPSAAGASGAQLSVTAKDGVHAVIIGKTAGDGNFARRVGENGSYIVEPVISFEAEPRYWIEPHLLDIPAASIQSVELKPVTGAGYTVHRAAAPPAAGKPAAPAPTAAPPAPSYVLEGVPAGRKSAESEVIAPSASTFGGLTADDVSPAGNIDFTKPTVLTVTLTDGSVVTLTGTSSGDKHWIEVKSSKDQALNAKAKGRAFEIASYRYDSLFRPVEQLLVPKPAPPEKHKADETRKPDEKHPPAARKPAASPVP